MPHPYPDATSISTSVRNREVSARAVIAAALARIASQNERLNCFTAVLAEQAMADADAIDQAISAGNDPGPLAGVPFAVKNLFDVAGLTTLAGSKISQEHPPAPQDATLIARLKQAGAILVGTLNMDEYAYGFVTVNGHYGTTPNPHDLRRISGGSSGGSAVAVASGLVPLTLGSDTNGSIRVPAALCGVFGLKPTYGRLSCTGVYPFSTSLDHAGLFARSVRDLAVAFDILQEFDPVAPRCQNPSLEACLPQLSKGIDGLRIAIADGYFAKNGKPEVFAAVEQVAAPLRATQRVTIPEAHRARAAAFIITASESGNLHLENLRKRPQDFDPATRDRLLAGALVPATWYIQAQRFRQWYRDRVQELFQQVDIILAPTTPCSAPFIGQQIMAIADTETLIRPNLGLFTQPLSFIGLPVISVPIQNSGQLPLGVQIIAAPHNEAQILQVAAFLESQGVIAAPVVE